MAKSEFKGLIQVMDNGDIRWFNPDNLRQFLKQNKGERFEFVVKKYRSAKQNKYLHVLIGMLADYLGFELEEMKDIIKFKFLKTEIVNEKTGEFFETVRDTRSLSKEEMTVLIDKLKQWAAEEFSFYLPDADEQMKMEISE